MILVRGECCGDILHGHVQSVDFVNRTVDVSFSFQVGDLLITIHM